MVPGLPATALGAVEVVAGLLLFPPRTATLGALLSLASMSQVFLLNMTYDVPVKTLSFHLLLVSAVLLAPQARRLADVLVLARPAQPTTAPRLFSSDKRNRIAATVSVALGVWVVVGCVVLNVQVWHEVGGGKPKPELYGIWEVTEFSLDGKPRPPLTTDETRWQRVVFDSPGVVTYQLTFDRSAPDRLRLDGRLEDRPVTILLRRRNLDDFTLRNRGFNWVQEQPYVG